MTITRALIVREPWISLILGGAKTWEMRSWQTRIRGSIALIRAGSMSVVGVTEIVDCRGPLSETEMNAAFEYHRIPANHMPDAISNKWVNALILRGARRLSREIPYKHSSQVKWVTLDQSVRNALESVAYPQPITILA